MSDVYDQFAGQVSTSEPRRSSSKKIRWRVEQRIDGWAVIREELDQHRVIGGRVIRYGIATKELALGAKESLERGYAP